jgi:methylmalonyl-CoA mutase N-terminal domain/subunit
MRMMGDVQHTSSTTRCAISSVSISGYHIAEARTDQSAGLYLANGFMIVEYYLARE